MDKQRFFKFTELIVVSLIVIAISMLHQSYIQGKLISHIMNTGIIQKQGDRNGQGKKESKAYKKEVSTLL